MNADKLFTDFVSTIVVTVDAEQLDVALESVSAVCETTDTVKVKFSPDSFTLSCETAAGTSTHRVQAAVKNPPSKEVYTNLHRLKNCVHTLTGKLILNFSEQGHLMLKTETMRYMQLASIPRVKPQPVPKEQPQKKRSKAA